MIIEKQSKQLKLLKFANEEERRSGWTISPSFLHEIQDELEDYEDCPSYESIELVLLVFNGLELPKIKE